MNSRSLDPVVKRNLESATMTSAVMSSQSAVVKKRKSWISDDEVSSEVSNQQRATVQPAVDSADALCNGNNQQWIQSQATESCNQSTKNPVASYSGPSRRLQCFAYPVVGNPDAGKADIVKSCNQAQRIQSSKYPDAVFEDTTSIEAVDELHYEELLKLDVNF
ncbi:DNA-directed RNA polymerase IV subunit 1 [Dorcoceras hygrometricum]|uniref:DNA-directed RNA polymerase IV subunit 1 n=1 Tax=Dorcoceras hygrometricum TaxID=472368 RepID=A0A2Z7AWD9_9LAMI|nr:DNA-directed RNA polymerase IV subunit 1 [Dorcoceras hygrometricum]